jgi:hypothetical protein
MNKASEKFHHQTEKARTFVQNWVSSNLTSMPDSPDIARETDRLASIMTGDARSLGISGSDISRAIGNIDDYLTSELEKRL